MNTKLAGNRDAWAFVGRSEWTQDAAGVINSPTWRFATDDVLSTWPNETDDRPRQDFAFLHQAALGDFELTVQVKVYAQTTNGQILFRAQDSRRFYALAIRDVYEKDIFELTLWSQNEHGLRRQLAQALGGTTQIRLPESQVPKWDTLRVAAHGPRLEVWLNDDQLMTVSDEKYANGVIGIGSMCRIQFKDLIVNGRAEALTKPWRVVPGTAPKFVYPYKSDTIDLTKPTQPRLNWPNGAALDDGQIILIRNRYDSRKSVLTRSLDNGRTWSDEQVVDRFISWPFRHKDGRLSALTSVTFDADGREIGQMTTELIQQVDVGQFKGRHELMRVYSSDDGRTWGEPQPFIADGKLLSAYGTFYGHTGLCRLSDDSILYCPFIGRSEYVVAEERTNQTCALRSEDDGESWSAPCHVEDSHCDTNEAAVAELLNGDLLVFMRSVRSPFLWKARSKDQGRSWLPLEKTDLTLDCPLLLRHSSGLIVLQTRGGALQVSADDGENWGSVWNIGHCIHMGCMVEAADGALVFTHLDAGFASLTKTRCLRLGITADGPVPCEDVV